MITNTNRTLTVPSIIFTGFLLATPITVLASPSDCEGLIGCEKKFCQIEAQLSIATKADNSYKVAGLTKALKAAQHNCTNGGLKDELLEDIEEETQEIIAHEQALKQAHEDNKADKIRKYQEKINERTNKLMQLESELSS